MSRRRTLLSLLISLSVTWIVALGCIEGIARRDGVFLRTAKKGSRRSIIRAVRLSRVELVLAVALFGVTGWLLASSHRAWLLALILFIQALVYLCAPTASVWSLWAQGVPVQDFRRRFEERRRRAARTRRAFAQAPRRTAAALTAVCVGGLTSAFIGPIPLLHATAVHRAALAKSQLDGAEMYMKLGSSAYGVGGSYYRISGVKLSTTAANITLRFDTSSLRLLGEVLRAGQGSGLIGPVSVAFRGPGGTSGRPATGLVETFATAIVSSFDEHLSGKPSGSISLLLPVVSHVDRSPVALQDVTQSADLAGQPAGAGATKVYLRIALAGGIRAVTSVELSQSAALAPVSLSFATSSRPLLDAISRIQGIGLGIPSLKLSVRAGGSGRLFVPALTDTFRSVNVGSFAANLSGPISGTATLLVGRP